jgi:hypothetical protein
MERGCFAYRCRSVKGRRGLEVGHRGHHANLATNQRRHGLDRAHFFLEGGAMKFIEKSAVITGEYWVRVY